MGFAAFVSAFLPGRRSASTDDHGRLPSLVDPTTGLPNIRALREEFVPHANSIAARNRILTVAIIDLIAPSGTILTEVATAIAARLPPDSRIARVNESALACILSFDRIVPGAADHLANLLAVAGHPALGSAAMGLARLDRDGSSIDALIEAATLAAAVARAAGRRIMWHDPTVAAHREAEEGLARSLPTAIADGAVIPYFEPCVDLVTGALTGFEVLARWRHPTHGMIEPASFISLAEDGGVIGDLSLSLMRQAFAVARDWDDGLMLAFNLSAQQLRDPWLAQKILNVLVQSDFPAHRLEVELTEAALFDPHSVAPSLIESLKVQGVRVALDDFGAGVSSLPHLRALPFDRIKIDRSIITRITDDPGHAEIAATIIALGDILNLPITAEGVENTLIADRLRAMGCNTGQGYLYGQPLSAIQARRMLAEQRLIRFAEPDPTSLRLAG